VSQTVPSLQPTATISGEHAAYKDTVTPNYITGAGITHASTYRGFRAAEEASNVGAPPIVTVGSSFSLAIVTPVVQSHEGLA